MHFESFALCHFKIVMNITCPRTQRSSGMQLRKNINGLRAIAVIAVALFHFNSSCKLGVGVDVLFFGFLMTGIIFRGLEQ
jgi:peptidoglycan/LPS O-acetylase OafA/YrhL